MVSCGCAVGLWVDWTSRVEWVLSACAFDELWGPVSCGEEGVCPFEECDGWAVGEGCDEFRESEEAVSECEECGCCLLFSLDGSADGEDVVEDGLDGRRVERDDLRLG